MLGHGEPFPLLPVDPPNLVVFGVGRIDNPAAIAGQRPFDIVPDGPHGAIQPVVAVDDVIGLELGHNAVIHDVLLDDHARDASHCLDHFDPFLAVRQGKPVEFHGRTVAEHADNHLAVLTRLVDQIDMPGMNGAGGEAGINRFHNELDLLVITI